jgi:ADP-ribose pyrophosphatase YjhB (NUDIX family)
MTRRYPDRPLTGVGAIILRQREVLLVKRGHAPSAGKWSIPGGLVELGESLDGAVCREVFEEVGLEVRTIDLVAALDRVILDAEGQIEYHYILLDFLCEIVSGSPGAGSDADECRFVPLDDLFRYDLTTGTEEVIRSAWERVSASGSNKVYCPGK